MQSMNLEEAAEFLNANIEVLRKKAAIGKVPAAKINGKWLFLKEDLVVHIRANYNQHGHELRVIDGGKSCQSLNAVAVKTTSLKLRSQMEDEYNSLRGRATKSKPKNCTTN
jgi:hypothetical protein